MVKSPQPRQWRGLRLGDWGWDEAARGDADRALRVAVQAAMDDPPRPGSADGLVEALDALQRVERAIPRLRRALVAQSRVAGAPWSSIGQGMGVGRTAAQKRYADLDLENEERVSSAEELEAAISNARHVIAFGLRYDDMYSLDQVNQAEALLRRHGKDRAIVGGRAIHELRTMRVRSG